MPRHGVSTCRARHVRRCGDPHQRFSALRPFASRGPLGACPSRSREGPLLRLSPCASMSAAKPAAKRAAELWLLCKPATARAAPAGPTISATLAKLRAVRLDQLQAVAERVVDEDAFVAGQWLVLGDLAAMLARARDEAVEVAHHESRVRLAGGAKILLDPEMDFDRAVGEPGAAARRQGRGL